MIFDAINIEPGLMFRNGGTVLQVSERVEGTYDYQLIDIANESVAFCGSRKMVADYLSNTNFTPYVFQSMNAFDAAGTKLKVVSFKSEYFVLDPLGLVIEFSDKKFSQVKAYLDRNGFMSSYI